MGILTQALIYTYLSSNILNILFIPRLLFAQISLRWLCILQGKGDGLQVERSGLHDNWDDAEGYYSKFQI